MSGLSLISLADRINREHQAALRDASSAIERARSVGKLLLEAKERCDRGKWESWLTENCADISGRTAQRYMDIARHPEIEAVSVRDAILKLAPAAERKPNKTTRVSPPQVTEYSGNVQSVLEGRRNETAEAEYIAAVADLPKGEQLSAAKSPPPRESQEAEPDRPDEEDEAAALEAAELGWRERLDRVMAADEKLPAMAAELKRMSQELEAMRQARDRYMNENAALLKQNKALQRKLDRLEKKAA